MAGKTKNCKHEIASRLPSKLYERLMPFQKEGVEFAVRKNGRFVYGRVMWIQTRTYFSFRVSTSQSKDRYNYKFKLSQKSLVYIDIDDRRFIFY